MSDLGIFSLLVVGRDMPHPFARTDAAARKRADRETKRKPGSRAEMLEPIIEAGGAQSPERIRRMS